MTAKPFPAYEGDGPFFFVSYAHDDDKAIYAEMDWIHEAGFNLWYDDGIHVGTVWRQALADALTDSVGLLFFATEKSVQSSNCLKEINFALDEDKPVFVVQLDETPLPSLLRLALSDRQAIRRGDHDESVYRDRLSSSLASIAPPGNDESGQQIETRITRVAVVPFRAVGGNDELPYMAEGVTDGVVKKLSGFPWTVVSGEREDEAAPQAAGERLNADIVVSGVLRLGKDRARLLYKLTDVATGEVISRTMQFRADDLLQAEDKMIDGVEFFAAFMEIPQLERQRIRDLPLDTLDAYALCLQHGYWGAQKYDEYVALKPALELAVICDPELGYAHASLASLLTFEVINQYASDPVASRERALMHADRALEAGTTYNRAYYHAAEVHGILGDLDRARFLAGRGYMFDQSPKDFIYMKTQVRLGEYEQALETVIKDRRRVIMAAAAMVHLGVDDFDAALDILNRNAAGFPEFPMAFARCAALYARLGDEENMQRCLDNQVKYLPDFTLSRFAFHERMMWRHETVLDNLFSGFRNLGMLGPDD